MTIEELIDRLPEALRPVARQYAPAIIGMTVDELWAWIGLLVAGDNDRAYRTVLERLPSPDLVAEWAAVRKRWEQANDLNAARLALQRRAVLAVLQACLTVALAMVGL